MIWTFFTVFPVFHQKFLEPIGLLPDFFRRVSRCQCFESQKRAMFYVFFSIHRTSSMTCPDDSFELSLQALIGGEGGGFVPRVFRGSQTFRFRFRASLRTPGIGGNRSRRPVGIYFGELHRLYTPPKFNSFPLKNDGWKTILSYWVKR